MAMIAEQLGVSRSTVSRLLSYARDEGIVEIRVRPSAEESTDEVALALRDHYQISVHAVVVPADVSESERLDRVAVSAAQLVTDLVTSHMTVGVAWGSTMAAVSRHLARKSTTGTRIVQLNGSGNTRTTGLGYASDILRRFGQAFSAQVQQFPVPAFFDDPSTKAALWRERSMLRILHLQSRLDMIVYSIGARDSTIPSHVYADEYLDADDLAELEREHVVGDVATVFYRLDGSSSDIAMNERASGPALETLARVPRRVCVAAGSAKADSLRGALAAGLVTDLVVDQETALTLLESSRQPASPAT